MNKTFCDRCGKEVKSKVLLEGFVLDSDTFDMCRTCYQEFEKWMKGGK